MAYAVLLIFFIMIDQNNENQQDLNSIGKGAKAAAKAGKKVVNTARRAGSAGRKAAEAAKAAANVIKAIVSAINAIIAAIGFPEFLAFVVVIVIIAAIFTFFNNPFSGPSDQVESGFEDIQRAPQEDWNNLYSRLTTTSSGSAGNPTATGSYADCLKALAQNLSQYDQGNAKTNLGLVQFCKNAANAKCGYVWGWHGREITSESMKEWQKSSVAQSEEACSTDADVQTTLNGWTHKPGFDCAGLMTGYMCFDPNKTVFTGNSHGFAAVANSLRFGTVDAGSKNADNSWGRGATYGNLSHNQKEMPLSVPVGAAVLRSGHVAVFVGNDPQRGAIIVEAAGYDEGVKFSYGLNSTRSSSDDFTWWIKLPHVTYK